MGEAVESRTFTREDRHRSRKKVQRSLDVLARMLSTARFDFDRPQTGLEIELNLVDRNYDPAMKNAEVLALISDPVFQTELGQWNLEINLHPRRLLDRGLETFEAEIRESLNAAEEQAATLATHIVMIGILPTLMPRHLGLHSLSANARYAMMNEAIFAARGEDLALRIDGPERLAAYADTIMPEAACTSTQFHLQVSPEDFASAWNAAQCVAGVQLALGANSPYFYGKELWRETRIALFEQATDTRPEELVAQGVRPRVWFGERWVTSIFDLFEENVRYFPALLPVLDDEDPAQVLERGDTPRLAELRLHNGTVWRWNRPVYDVVHGLPHVRVENRVLPAGPTVVDTLANGAFYFGVVRALMDADRPVWSQTSFTTAEDNFHRGARDGIDATVFWPGWGEVPATELVLRHLLRLADEGLAAWGVDTDQRDRLLGIIEQRCLTHRNGASWQVETVRALEQRHHRSRAETLQAMLERYTAHMHTNEPVHSWPVG